MAAQELLPFAIGAGANVITPEAYAALAARITGFSAGTANSSQLNTAWRQTAFVAAMIGFFTMHNSGQDVLDNGDLDTFEQNFKDAIKAVAAEIVGEGGGGTPMEHFLYTFTPGVHSLTVDEGCSAIEWWAWGGGGGGGGAPAWGWGDGGSGGAFRAGIMPVTPGDTIPITVGARGVAGGSGGGKGTNGGATSISSFITCGGGIGGNQILNGPSPGGVGSGGQWGTDGTDGSSSAQMGTAIYYGAEGGGTFGSSISKVSFGGFQRRLATGPGAGGPGTTTAASALPGHDGADGLVLAIGIKTSAA
jgi:hypothetical protein